MSPVEALDSRIAVYRLVLDELTALRAEMTGEQIPSGEPPVGKPDAADPTGSGSAAALDPSPAVPDDFRPRSKYMLPVLRALGAANGPLSMSRIAELIGKSTSAFFAAPMKACPWFEVTNPGASGKGYDPTLWRLSASGSRRYEYESAAGTAGSIG